MARCGLFLLTRLWCRGVDAQDTPVVNGLTVRPVRRRISDAIIEADKQVFRRIRRKLEAAKTDAIFGQACTLARAEASLDFAEEEYDENEEGEIVDVTLRESQRLLRSSDQSAETTSVTSPLFDSPNPARPDLWLQLKQIRERGASCACTTLARLEVDEVCPLAVSLPSPPPVEAPASLLPVEEPAPVVVSPSPEPPVVQAAAVPVPDEIPLTPEPSVPTPSASIAEPLSEPELLSEPLQGVISLATLPWSVHFPTNRATVSPSTAKVLDKVNDVLLRRPITLIRLEGHADHRRDASYNKMLSERRTQSVKAHLVNAGIKADRISTTAIGKSQPLSRSRQNRELARNRRVVIVVTNIEEIRSEKQDSDLRMDQRKRRKPLRQIELRAKQRQSNKVKTGRSRETR